jgi:small-conductance mechanosensitive channel
MVANREITVFRSSVLGRSSYDRAATSEGLLHVFATAGGPARADVRFVESAAVFLVDGHEAFALLPTDVDDLSGETLDSNARLALSHLQVALDEVREGESARALGWGAVQAAAVTIVFIVVLVALRRVDRAATNWLAAATERRLSASLQLPAGVAMRSRVIHYGQRAVDIAILLVVLVIGYGWLTFVLRRFPYSRPWGDAIRGFLLDRLEWLASGLLHAIPGFVTIALIVVVTRVVQRLLNQWFLGVEQGHVRMRVLFPETVPPTRRITATLLWLFALVVAYPFLPGSGTDAFKGVSVFLGLVISLGSTGIVNQVMSGLTVTYSRALRVGDYVGVGEIEGTVMHLGALSTKIQTPRGEDVTIPNAVIVSREVTNYSRNPSQTPVLASTAVTIGYDTPWRQVESLLRLAASRTTGLRTDPAPMVVQSSLQDFYVEYTLFVCLDEPRMRRIVLGTLRANIQDAFNEYGVQIMSPHYLGDPPDAKVVPKERWSAAPADGAAAREKK